MSALNRSGKLHRFDIHEEVFERWEKQSLVTEIKDYDLQTGTYNHEFRFAPEISEQLNWYMYNGEF
ncbi:hypothetical protein JD969_16920 [Planctomycetota bacterium]|nr:hypothetical protein JD969_16920 [Planctomycetota bacterium]